MRHLQGAIKIRKWDQMQFLKHEKSGVIPCTSHSAHRPSNTDIHSVCPLLFYFSIIGDHAAPERAHPQDTTCCFTSQHSPRSIGKTIAYDIFMLLFVFLRLRYMEARTDWEIDAQASRLLHSSINLAWPSYTVWPLPFLITSEKQNKEEEKRNCRR